jgi:hypothetical protein
MTKLTLPLSLLGIAATAAVAEANPPSPEQIQAFSERCFADYAEFRTKWGPVEKRTRDAMAGVAGKDFYTAYGKLRALYIGLAKQANDLQLNAGASFAQAIDDGIAFEVASAIIKLQRDHHMDSEQTWQPNRFSRGHAVTGDDEYDRNHYCLRAWNIGTHRHSPQSIGSREERFSAPWLPKAEAATFEMREDALFDQSVSATKLGEQRVKTDAEFGLISSIERHDANVTLRLAHYDVGYSCQRTDRIEKIEPDGTIHYAMECMNDDHAKLRYTLTVTFLAEALPVALRKGDQIGFFGVQDGGTEGHPVWKGMFVSDLSRRGKALGDWYPYFAEQLSVPHGYGGY